MQTDQLGRWNTDLARVIAAQGSDAFFPRLVAALAGQVQFVYPQVWLYHSDLPPRVVYHDIPEDSVPFQLAPYHDGPYRENPFYQVSMNQPRSKIYRLARVATRRLRESSYYQNSYVDNGVVDEVVFLAQLQGGSVINLCLKRREQQGEFSDADYQLLYLLAEPVSALVRFHCEHREFAVNQLIQPDIDRQIDLAFRTFGASLLSPREKDVLELMLRGYGTELSADRLDIAVETVRRHRKSIYRKLDVNSQTDLFSLFINSMSCLGLANGDDPLKVYMAQP